MAGETEASFQAPLLDSKLPDPSVLELMPRGSVTGAIARWGAWANIDGRSVVATGGDDAKVRLWDPSESASPRVLDDNAGSLRWGTWASVNGRPVLATGGVSGRVRLWDPSRATPPRILAGHTGPVLWGAWDSGNRQPVLATGGASGRVFLWDPNGTTPPRVLGGGSGRLLWGAWATVDGRPVLATGGVSGRVRLWDPSESPSPRVIAGHTGPVLWGAWATVEGRPVLAAGGDDATVRLWDPSEAVPPRILAGHTGPVLWGAWATVEGRPMLATGGDDGHVGLWDPSETTPLQVLAHHTGPVLWGAWANVEGRPMLATGGDDGHVGLWDPSETTPLRKLAGHTGPVLWGAWANVDGCPMLATGGEDATVRLWELREVRVTARLPGYHSDAITGGDELNRTGEATALAELVTARSALPPLAVGVFGAWGEGKSQFLRLLAEQVTSVSGRADELSHDAVRQVWFNAWHYAEADLWASLVSEIFTQLATPAGGDAGDDAERMQRQQSRLAAELAERRKIADRLAAARSRRDQLRRASTRRPWRLLSSEQQAELRAAAGEVNPALTEQANAFYNAAIGQASWVRVRLLQLRRLRRALPWWVWLALLLTAAGLVGLEGQLQPVVSKLVGTVGVLGIITALLAARQATTEVREAIAQAAEAVKRVGQAQRRQVDTAVQMADSEVVALERQLRDLTPAGALAGLAADRAAEGGYRRNLGLMTQVREDFQRMAKLLARAEHDRQAGRATRAADTDEAGDELPKIDRIVLYIDDLDRCPPARVVEVLEAVHLLLAVPLFVVIVAVDPRWLMRAVKAHYRTMLETDRAIEPNSGTAGPEVDPDNVELWASTPAQYLEKIFQVVLTLPALTTDGYTRMLDSLTALRETELADHDADTAPIAAGPRSANTDGDNTHPAVNAETMRDDPAELSAARILERIDPLALRADERQLMRLLGPPLITTPRAVKRLTNSYGLLTAIHRQHTPTGPAPTESGSTEVDSPAMVLLAALIGFPAQGPALFTHLHRESAARPDLSMSTFLNELAPQRAETHWRNRADPHLTAVQTQDWRTLLAALHQIIHDAPTAGINLPESAATWARWVIPVGRLSFPTGRIVSSLGHTRTRRP